jgi:hypothetical protein
MEEKRRLEKLLLADIDRASDAYRSARRAKREPLASDAVRRASAEVKALYDMNERARKEMIRTEEALRSSGYVIHGYSDGRYLSVGHAPLPKSLQAFDDQTSKTEGALNELKRTYTLKLFAGGEEAQGLFATLMKELVSIVS